MYRENTRSQKIKPVNLSQRTEGSFEHSNRTKITHEELLYPSGNLSLKILSNNKLTFNKIISILHNTEKDQLNNQYMQMDKQMTKLNFFKTKVRESTRSICHFIK